MRCSETALTPRPRVIRFPRRCRPAARAPQLTTQLPVPPLQHHMIFELPARLPRPALPYNTDTATAHSPRRRLRCVSAAAAAELHGSTVSSLTSDTVKLLKQGPRPRVCAAFLFSLFSFPSFLPMPMSIMRTSRRLRAAESSVATAPLQAELAFSPLALAAHATLPERRVWAHEGYDA